MKFKLIKTKEFEVKGVKHLHHTVAYKGRVFGLNSLRWEGTELKVEGDTVSVDGECELKKIEQVDLITQEKRTFIDIVPKLELVLAVC